MERQTQKSLLTAYLCWLFGGLFGLHHLYLERDDHAFITFCSLGGYFTLGLIRDLWRLPEYVKDANNNLDYLDKLHSQIKTHKRPPSSVVRQSGLMMVGNLFAYLIDYAIPEELLNPYVIVVLKLLLIPLASAVGVWLVGNVGRHKGTLRWPLMAAYFVAIPTTLFKIPTGSFTTLAATIVFNRYSKKWRLNRKPKASLITRCTVLLLCVCLYLTLWSSWLYFNCNIEDEDTGEMIKCRDAINNFLKSPAFVNLAEAIEMLVEHACHKGFVGLWQEIVQEFDMTGKNSAMVTLGLDENATPQEIIAQYRKLSREYHPDKEKDPALKSEKQEKFIQIQQAYTLLEATVRRYKKEKGLDIEDKPLRDEL